MNWLPVKNYENLYEVSDTGLVRSIDRTILHKTGNKRLHKGKLLVLTPHKDTKYLTVSLWKNNKGKLNYVHRLVAQAFILNPDSLPEVNHIDGNKQNNIISNLEWVTRVGNVAHAISTGLKVYDNRLSEKEFLQLVYDVIAGESYFDLSKRVNYKVPFLSTKLKQVATKYGLINELKSALAKQKLLRNQNAEQKKIPIAQFDLQGNFIKKYESIRQASRELNISSGAISNAVSGKTKTCKGFMWKLA